MRIRNGCNASPSLLMIIYIAMAGICIQGCLEKALPMVHGGIDGTDTCPCAEGWACLVDTCHRRCDEGSGCKGGEYCAAGGLCVAADEPVSFHVGLTDLTKLDLLFVVDNTASMCQEQMSLARGFQAFADQLAAYLNLDIHVAVTTTDALGGQGAFSVTPATVFPPTCSERVRLRCFTDGECEESLGEGWSCDAPQSPHDIYTLNLSINSTCLYYCEDDAACCGNFCHQEECDDDPACMLDMCASSEGTCTQACVAPGGQADQKNCIPQPDTQDCPKSIPAVLTQETLDLFPCLAVVGADMGYTAGLGGGLKAAWMALDPSGPQAEQAAGFLRDDAYLAIVFVTDEDDCSIDEDFCSPSFDCEDDFDCHYGAVKCRNGLCCGDVKSDYGNVCALLGEYKGKEHHDCAYNLNCHDCESDADCEDGWYCKIYSMSKGSKCRPFIYGFSTVASFQSPAGTPIFALAPVSEFYNLFRSLKDDPDRVFVAAFVGDSLVRGSDEESLISEECLADEKLGRCQDYVLEKTTASGKCLEDPYGPGCEDLLQARIECARQCFIASKGDYYYSYSRNSYACSGEMGVADLGQRYLRLVEMFGDNGLSGNLCEARGLEPSLELTAERLIKRLKRVCLPLPVQEGEMVEVTLLLPGEDPVHLIEGPLPGGDFQVIQSESTCCDPDDEGQCIGSETALAFHALIAPDAEIRVSYMAASFSIPRVP